LDSLKLKAICAGSSEKFKLKKVVNLIFDNGGGSFAVENSKNTNEREEGKNPFATDEIGKV
jgi:hypothetical protein